MKVGLLGLQGAFLDHIRHLEKIGVDYHIVKSAAELDKVDRLIIPGGESTVMEKFLDIFDMTGPLKEKIQAGLPVWGICAGAILLAKVVDARPGILGVLPAHLIRNAYGRQLESSEKFIEVPALRRTRFPAQFIRAPRIESVEKEVSILASVGGDPVFVRCEHVMTTTFHPELTGDSVFHEFFVREV
ncbi:MAG: pyridoxal 5'-phosphate synthase glutaminase subunit PdxT [Desulfobacterales bacterium]|nr:pyridoxal 5'-phosphate synthase glutaminase subunit PdxT [Desulfobacterales bacterium]